MASENSVVGTLMSEDEAVYNRHLCSYLAGILTEPRRDRLLRLVFERTRHLTVVVEDLYQSHNTSACIRSCDCFGLQDVHVIENRNRFRTSKDIARGASQWVTIHRYNEPDSTAACLKKLKSADFQIVMTSPHDTDCDLETYDISQKTALVFGNEKQGASDTVRQYADHVMRIPMFGFTESFNISVAAAVCLHHLVWRMRQLDLDWRLSQEEREPLLLDWVKTSTTRYLKDLEGRFREEWEAGRIPAEEPLWPDWDSVDLSTPPLPAVR